MRMRYVYVSTRLRRERKKHADSETSLVSICPDSRCRFQSVRMSCFTKMILDNGGVVASVSVPQAETGEETEAKQTGLSLFVLIRNT